MTNPDPKAAKKIDAYIAKRPAWQQEICRTLRQLIHRADPQITEDWKWGSPAFTHDGLVCFFWAFTKHASITFYQGALLKDPKKLFNAGTSNDRSRVIKFFEGDTIPERDILRFVKEAVRNNEQGKVIVNPKPTYERVTIPADFRRELVKNDLLEIYKALTYYQRKGWIQWIQEAKRSETRKKRIERALSRVKQGKYM